MVNGGCLPQAGPRHRRTGHRRRHLWPVTGLITVAVIIALVLLGVVHHEQVEAEHRDPSFRYGQQIMINEIYSAPLHGSLRDACRNAMQNPPGPPPGLNKSKAIDGCLYEETLLDD